MSTERTTVEAQVEVPELRASEVLKVEASGYVAAELLDRIGAPKGDAVELVRFTPNHDGNWSMPSGSPSSPVFDYVAGVTYAVVEVPQ